jgi:hypothetical protein
MDSIFKISRTTTEPVLGEPYISDSESLRVTADSRYSIDNITLGGSLWVTYLEDRPEQNTRYARFEMDLPDSEAMQRAVCNYISNRVSIHGDATPDADRLWIDRVKAALETCEAKLARKEEKLATA